MGLMEFIGKVDKKLQEIGDSVSDAINTTGSQIGDNLNKGMEQLGREVDTIIKAEHAEVPQYTGDGSTSFQDIVNSGVVAEKANEGVPNTGLNSNESPVTEVEPDNSTFSSPTQEMNWLPNDDTCHPSTENAEPKQPSVDLSKETKQSGVTLSKG